MHKDIWATGVTNQEIEHNFAHFLRTIRCLNPVNSTLCHWDIVNNV